MFDQPEFEALLRGNLKRYSGVRLRNGAEVTAATDHEGHVRVTFADRTGGQIHHMDADYLLGCDGANSLVRAQIGSAMADLKFEQRWLVVDITTGSDLKQWEGVHQVCDPVRAATYMRIGQARYRWEFRLLPGESAGDFDTVRALRPLIAPWTGDIPDSELTLRRVTEYTFRAQCADRWRNGRIFLLGDAAHLTPPFIGQGMGAGVRDAMNLSWKLAGVLNGTLATGVLDSYQHERKPHALSMIRLALAIGQSMTGGGRFGNLARRVVLPRLRWVPGLRAKVMDSTTPALRPSALVSKSRRGRRLVGTLCPNPELREGQRLDALLGTNFALITTQRPDATDDALLRQRGVVVLVAERGSELELWLRRGRTTAAIVRPDRTVMCARRDVAALCERLALAPLQLGNDPKRRRDKQGPADEVAYCGDANIGEQAIVGEAPADPGARR